MTGWLNVLYTPVYDDDEMCAAMVWTGVCCGTSAVREAEDGATAEGRGEDVPLSRGE